MEELLIANGFPDCLGVANGLIANCERKYIMLINCEQGNCELRTENQTTQELRTENQSTQNKDQEIKLIPRIKISSIEIQINQLLF